MTNEATDMSDDTENTTPEGQAAERQAAADSIAEDAGAQPAGDGPDGDEGVTAETGESETPLDGPDRLAALEEQVADLGDKLLRAVAETENVRRRAQREKEDASKYAISGFAGDMVSVADNLMRALASIDDETRANDEAVNNLMSGVEMTLRDLLNTFERTGIKRIEAMDRPFDHNFHEAMFEMEDPGKPSGTVMQVVQDGYTLRDRLLRPAKVGVSKGGPKAPPAVAVDDTPRETGADQAKAYEQGKQGAGANLDEEL